MLYATRGIVLKSIPYSDSASIVRIYTEQFGLQAFMVNMKGKRSGLKGNLFQPLTLVDMVMYHKEKKQLQRIREIKIDQPYFSIPSDIAKSSMTLFLAEVLQKTIREEEKNPALFEFIRSAMQVLDLKPESCANFHLLFLVQFTKYLGFFPQGKWTTADSLFDLKEGAFTASVPSHPHYLMGNIASNLSDLMDQKFDAVERISIPSADRRGLLRGLIEYYHLHITHMQEIRSHLVLEEVIS